MVQLHIHLLQRFLQMLALGAPGTDQFVPIAQIRAQDAIGLIGAKGTPQQSIGM